MNTTNTTPDVMLQIDNLESYYGPIMAIRGVSLKVHAGQIVTVLGPMGLARPRYENNSGVMAPQKGTVTMEGTAIQSMEPDAIVRRGIVHVPEGREIFPLMTVGENIAMGAYTCNDRSAIAADEETIIPISRSERPPCPACRHAVGRSATDVSHRARTDVSPQADVAGRAKPGLSLLLTQEISRSSCGHQRTKGHDDAGRAECKRGARCGGLWLCDGAGAHRDG